MDQHFRERRIIPEYMISKCRDYDVGKITENIMPGRIIERLTNTEIVYKEMIKFYG